MPNSVPSTIISATPTTGAEHRALVRRDSTVLARLRRTETAPDVLRESWRRALGGGLAGAMAMVVQVTTLMWVRTTVMFQYRYGSTTSEAMRQLYRQGGFRRFYQGISAALLQAPLSRFGDTAANHGTMSLLNSNHKTRDLPTGVKTIASATAATVWRIALMPLDTVKSMMQVEGAQGLAKLQAKAKAGGPAVLFHGAGGLVSQAFLGHYFWYGTYNFVDAKLQTQPTVSGTLLRNATVGFSASVVSDTATNSLRVLKTFRQTSEAPITYGEAARAIIKSDGLVGLFGRGLTTRLLANGLQAAAFSVCWKSLERRLRKHL